MSDDFDVFVESLTQDVADASRDFVGKVREDVKERLSVPVGYRIGPRGGSYKIRSRPGEPARKDLGPLSEGILDETEVQFAGVYSQVSSDQPYAETLEADLGRLVITDLMPAYEDGYFDAIVEAADQP